MGERSGDAESGQNTQDMRGLRNRIFRYRLEDIMNNFGHNLRSFRKYKGLSQSELSGIIGVSQVQISAWERSKYKPNLYNIQKISNILGVSIESITNGKQSKPINIQTIEWEEANKPEKTKVCSTCKKEKPATKKYFYGNASKKDGLQNECIQCKKEYSKRHSIKNQTINTNDDIKNSNSETVKPCTAYHYLKYRARIKDNKILEEVKQNEDENPNEAIAIVNQWTKENPLMTYLQRFLNAYPSASLSDEGFPVGIMLCKMNGIEGCSKIGKEHFNCSRCEKWNEKV